MKLPFGIQQSTLAGGLTGVVTWGIGLLLTQFGINIPADALAGIVAIIVPIVVHYVPDAAKVDTKIKDIAAELPQTYSASTDFPNAPSAVSTPNNINKG